MINHKNKTVHLNLESYTAWSFIWNGEEQNCVQILYWPMTAWFQLNYQYTLLKNTVTCPSESHHMLKDSWIPKFIRVLLSQNNCLWQSRCSELGGGWTCSRGNETSCHWWIPHTPTLVSECKDNVWNRISCKDKESLVNTTLSCGDLNCESLFYFNSPHDEYN